MRHLDVTRRDGSGAEKVILSAFFGKRLDSIGPAREVHVKGKPTAHETALRELEIGEPGIRHEDLATAFESPNAHANAVERLALMA